MIRIPLPSTPQGRVLFPARKAAVPHWHAEALIKADIICMILPVIKSVKQRAQQAEAEEAASCLFKAAFDTASSMATLTQHN